MNLILESGAGASSDNNFVSFEFQSKHYTDEHIRYSALISVWFMDYEQLSSRLASFPFRRGL